MTEKLIEKLKIWAEQNNWELSHPLDEERFLDFIIEAYREGADVGVDEFSKIIRKSTQYKLSDNDLEEIYIRYEFGVYLLKKFNK